MEASKLIDQITLELMLKKSIDPGVCLPLIVKLKAAAGDTQTAALVGELEKMIGRGGKSESEPYTQCLSLLEALSFRVHEQKSASPAGKPQARRSGAHAAVAANSTVLAYDATHGSEILDSFFSEVSGHLQDLEQKLLKLESDCKNSEALNSVFGAMHSLKGIMGFLDLKCAHELAHEAEAVMDRARTRDRGIDPTECDAILRTVDVLREIKALILAHSRNPGQPFPKVPTGCSALLSELRNLASRGGNKEKSTTAAPVPVPETAPTSASNGHLDSGSKTQVVEAASAVRVKVEKLDNLMEAIGELVVVQAQVHQDPILRQIDSPRIIQNLSQLGKITRDLQSIAMALRMYPLRDLFGRITRLARDLAHKQNKEVEIVISGDETELDKNVIEALVDPLTHLVRNAIDHGVDFPDARIAAGKAARARLTIAAHHQSGNVIVKISDDGRGLNRDRIWSRAVERGLVDLNEKPSDSRIHNLIFEPGFSTAERVTELSGRGVGLDVVRRNIQALGGYVTVASVAGQSTTFALTLPLTLAIIDGLIIRAGSERYIVPITSVVESVRPTRQQISTIQEGGEVINVRGTLLPLIRLSEFTGIAPTYREPWNAIVMIIECGNDCCGLMVDELLGQQQVVIRSLGEHLKDVRGIASGTILGDGRVGLILDVAQLARRYGAARHAHSAPIECVAG